MENRPPSPDLVGRTLLSVAFDFDFIGHNLKILSAGPQDNPTFKDKIKSDGQECPSYMSVVVFLTIARCRIAK
jgi:hypothetical protein